jgi:hypothetical protein
MAMPSLLQTSLQLIYHLFILDCSAPVIELVPFASSLSTPLKFRPNQNLYISSNIHLNCNQSLFIIKQWTVVNCSSICSNEIQLNQSIETSQSNLFIPSRTLSNGIYELKLRVTIVDFPVSTSSSSVYIEILSSTIITKFISFDTLMITHDYQQNLILNPGEFSFIENSIRFNKNVDNYLQY